MAKSKNVTINKKRKSKKVPTLDDIPSFDEVVDRNSLEVVWGNLFRLREISDNGLASANVYMAAHRVIKDCIDFLVENNILTGSIDGTYSVYVERRSREGIKYKERMDPSYEGDSFSFFQESDAQSYLDSVSFSFKGKLGVRRSSIF